MDSRSSDRPNTDRDDRHRRRHRRSRTGSQSRSRSPPRHTTKRRRRDSDHDDNARERPRDRDRDRDHTRHRRHDHRHRDADHAQPNAPAAELPFSARRLGRDDLTSLYPLLAYYLEVQKERYVDEMDEREIRGRWKAFRSKWNRAELAAGWYDPELYAKVAASAGPAPVGGGLPGTEAQLDQRRRQQRRREASRDGDSADDNDDDDDDNNNNASVAHTTSKDSTNNAANDDSDSDSDSVGPLMPPPPGARPPTLADLDEQDAAESHARATARADLAAARRTDRAQQRERLEDAAPRADAGSHERRIEKRREATERNREVGRARRGGSPAGIDDDVLFGGGDGSSGGGAGALDGPEAYKRATEGAQRRRAARESRREALERVRREEFEVRASRWREREESTVEMLRELARQRFG